jgi:hypothetical protein
MAKLLLKQFGYKIPVDWFSDYAIEFDPNDLVTPIKFYVQKPNQDLPIHLMEIEIAQREWIAELRLPVSYDLFAILHEIGHLESEQIDYEEYENDLNILENLHKSNLIDAKRYISLYNLLENEKNADEWAINWIKNNETVAKVLNSQIN